LKENLDRLPWIIKEKKISKGESHHKIDKEVEIKGNHNSNNGRLTNQEIIVLET